jgi:hypothetical protein
LLLLRDDVDPDDEPFDERLLYRSLRSDRSDRAIAGFDDGPVGDAATPAGNVPGAEESPAAMPAGSDDGAVEGAVASSV